MELAAADSGGKSASGRAAAHAVITVTGARLPAPAGPAVSATGANDYAVSAQDIASLPTGATSPMTDVLAQMPGVSIDQNQQIHIRDTEGPQFQYQINGVLIPLDINTNPPFLSMINPQFVKKLDLLDGVLPSRYAYATGGVVDIETKDGCEQPGGDATVVVGQRQIVEPSAQYAGCDGALSYYVSGLYSQGEDAFSSATPGANPVHDFTNQGQLFGVFAYQLDPATRVSLIVSGAASDNQLPNVPGLAPQFVQAGVAPLTSAAIGSSLDFRDALGVLALNGSLGGQATYQVAYGAHFISQAFRPDRDGELQFQGVASTATHYDVDNTLQGDIFVPLGAHDLSAGIYLGEYRVTANDSSLVFPDQADPDDETTVVQVTANTRATNVVAGVYLDDLWHITDRLSANLGGRLDGLTGFTKHSQFDPTFNLTYQASQAISLHGGVARYMQVPSLDGVSPDASAAFAGTTGAEPPGVPNPKTEDDVEVDVGAVIHPSPHLTLSQDDFYERTWRYLDTGQFGVAPIFAPFNYGRGYIWGSEFAVSYRTDRLTAYANLTLGQNWQKGIRTGQFNFDPDELAFINNNSIPLDHAPLAGLTLGASYKIGPYLISLDGVYSSGLRSGFADQVQLPAVVQINASVERRFEVPGVGKVVNRITVLNAFDRVNLIRPAEGIGIFQSAYGPRFTLLDSLTIPF